MEEDDDNMVEIKLKVNNLVWMYSPDRITLREAEDRAQQILQIILDKPEHEHT